jgi:hypothetical protein
MGYMEMLLMQPVLPANLDNGASGRLVLTRYDGAVSPDTGYNCDHSEGEADRDYFSTDELMFQVSLQDTSRPGHRSWPE